MNGLAQTLEITVDGSWEVSALFDQLPALKRKDVRLALEIMDAEPSHVRLRASSLLRMTYEGDWVAAALSTVDLFNLSGMERQIVAWMMREGVVGEELVSLAEVAAFIGQPEAMARVTLNALLKQGFIEALEREGTIRYRPRLVARRGRPLADEIWQALDGAPVRGGPETGFGQRIKGALLGAKGRSLLSVAPVVAIFFLAEWLLLTGAESFADPLGFLGVIVISLLGGTFPVLLLRASRRKGEIVPGLVLRWLGNPLVVFGIYLLFLANLFVHGLIIWQDPLERAAALAAGVLMIMTTLLMVRRNAFAPRAVIELREDQKDPGQSAFAVTARGERAMAEVRLGYADGEERMRASAGQVHTFSSLRRVHFHLPLTRAHELKVWAHRITADGDSVGLSALVGVESGGARQELDLDLSGGQIVVPIDSGECRVAINLWKGRRCP